MLVTHVSLTVLRNIEKSGSCRRRSITNTLVEKRLSTTQSFGLQHQLREEIMLDFPNKLAHAQIATFAIRILKLRTRCSLARRPAST